ncbi:hypothetical protein HDU80_004330 [Chytriomyces hyalinus]|nr:hypothetical protein HDU80_004330 [Chytriomyces hyalinus]
MSFSLLTVVQQSDGAINTLGYFDAAFAVQAAQGLRNSIVNVAFKVNNGNALCSATASLDPGAATVACPVTMGHPPNTQCVVAQCRNAPDAVPRGSQFYLIMDWGVCRSDTPAVTCRQWSENVLVSFNRLSSVQSSSTLPSSALPTSTAVGDNKSSLSTNGDTSNSNSGQQQQQQQPQKGAAQDNSVAITVPIVSVVAIAAGVFLFIKYRNLHRAKKRLQQTDLAAVFQSLNNTVPSSSTSKPVLPSSSNARSNQSIMSAAPLIKGKSGTSVHSSSVSARSNATLEQTPAYLDDESDAGTVSSFGAVDHVQFGQTANVTPSVYQSPNNISPFANYAYPPPVSTTTPDARTQQQPQYPGYYDQHGNYYFFATPSSVPVIPFPVVPSSVSSAAAAVGQVVPPVPAPSIPLPPSPVTSSNRRLPDEGAGDRK